MHTPGSPPPYRSCLRRLASIPKKPVVSNEALPGSGVAEVM
jgi:hypothetical protein